MEHIRSEAAGRCPGPPHCLLSRRRFVLRAVGVGLSLAGFVLLPESGALPSPARAQAGMRRVGYLSAGLPPPAGRPIILEAVKERLRELGWTEGQTISFELRYAENRNERLPDVAAELVSLQPDVIVVAGGTLQAAVAREATSTIPLG